jgi:hypothetical protein
VIVEPEMGMTVMAGEALGCMLVSHYVVTILINIPSLRYNLVKHTKSSGLRHYFLMAYRFLRTDASGGQPTGIGLSPLQFNGSDGISGCHRHV